ncbi:M56 family metallopeptidase [Hymenobacter setariae]|uniref:M56 family metallopeptidase n=1 Tax=Hymenobacter setariae TaxID=2594794 RepID=A0A558C494_9BACT|nr:M56 family metallopeptidase [Hymenobacter setariae]TVT43580.1 M56 family metallopeptidase [Hymenobacter setariae]
MMVYLVEASGCLLLALGFYKLVLETERVPQFKRFYLLASLLGSALLPLLSIEVDYAAVVPVSPPRSLPVITASTAAPTVPTSSSPQTLPDAGQGIALLYGVMTLLFIGRFSSNLLRLRRQIATYPQHAFHSATLVLLPGQGLPYAFLHYLFVSETAYRKGEVEAEVLTHELAHVRQYHSLDILLLEVILCVGWFNPLLYWLKRAMQLNHEFLADEAVNQCYHNVPKYQQLLLRKLAVATSPALTSTLTFHATKQRLLMMTKHTSDATRWLLGSSTTALFGLLILLFGTTALQVVPPPTAVQAAPTHPYSISGGEAEAIIRREGDKPVLVGKGLKKPYSSLSAADKQWVLVVRQAHPARRTPTPTQWAQWQAQSKYAVWVDERPLQHPLDSYQRTDIAAFMKNYNRAHTQHPDQPMFHLKLWTRAAYAQLLKSPLDTTLTLMFLPNIAHTLRAAK